MRKELSRRVVMPALVAGTGLAAAAGAAPAAKKSGFQSACGPCIVTRGQALTFSYFLPTAERNRPVKFTSSLVTLDGRVLVTFEDTVSPGKGVRFTLTVQSDGPCRLVRTDRGIDQELDVFVEEEGDLTVSGILVSLLLPAVQAFPTASVQCHNLVRNAMGAEVRGPVAFTQGQNYVYVDTSAK